MKRTDHVAGKLVAAVFLALSCTAATNAADQTANAAVIPTHTKMRAAPSTDVRWTDGFWADRFAQCRDVIVPHLWQVMQLPDNAATFNDLRMAAGLIPQTKPGGTKWSDGDCHKCIETMAHLYEVNPDPALDRLMDEAIAVIAKAQQPDGYLSSWVQLSGTQRWADLHNHELYNMGHLMTAAAVHYRATGKTNYLNVAIKTGDYLYKVFAPRPKELAHFGFNPSNIMGAVDLYRATGDSKYLKLAGIFVSMRGSAPGGSNQNQAAVSLRKEQEAVGHCVTATYLWCGAADVVSYTGDKTLRAALERLWIDVTTHKMYITGGTAAIHQGELLRTTFRRWPRDSIHEAFGANYQLPNRTAYNETCANIGNAMWNWRLLNLTGNAKYTDVVERVLYNSMLSSISLDGTCYFYTNPLRRCAPEVPLMSNDSAARWPDTTSKSPVHCFCCPPNISRTLAKLHSWVYSIAPDAVWVNLYGGSTLTTRLPNGKVISLAQQTNYPWDGKVTITVNRAPSTPTALMLRIPAWAGNANVNINGEKFTENIKPGSYLKLRRTWQPGDHIALALPMDTTFLQAHPLIEENRNHVAVMRGPMVYCLESPDLPAGFNLDTVAISPKDRWLPSRGTGILKDAVVLKGPAYATPPAAWTGPLYQPVETATPRRVKIQLIPYYTWANRGISQMEVWIPRALSVTPK